MDLPMDIHSAANLEQAFAGNRLLAALSAEERALLEPHAELISFDGGDIVLETGDVTRRSLFPFDGLMISMQRELSGGRSVEVAAIGREGAVGGIISCGHAPAFTRALVQLPGPAVAVPMAVLEQAKQESAHLRNLFCRYSDALLSQVMQSVACNAFHPIEARAARWLLHAQDRAASDRLALTQESLAGLLGVQRTTVNAVARVLQEQGLIAYRRGAIQVIDRAGLLRVSCDCYRAVEDHFHAVLGPDGRGTPPA
ncbi:transcriptional regulator [Sphingomonas astaxanthinifaciens DSM 22298]|uniref:Transcriptional regulator n=2 Tax=Sphingomonas TaxID=13687 RepID=A0ABQ5Z797_9SPHN|nr:transcriptional regulator [Sphingomonas astaxanthinifaciens DSM 22298]